MFFEDNAEYLLWAKQKFFDKGISTNEFRKCQVRDIKDVLDIASEINLKMNREQEVQEILAKQTHG